MIICMRKEATYLQKQPNFTYQCRCQESHTSIYLDLGEPTHTLMPCLQNPCLQNTSVWVGLPRPIYLPTLLSCINLIIMSRLEIKHSYNYVASSELSPFRNHHNHGISMRSNFQVPTSE